MRSKIVFFSGGMGSFVAAQRVFDENTHLLFTDTLIEDKDLYRFLLDSIVHFYGGDVSYERNIIENLTHTADDIEARKGELRVVQAMINAKYPKFHWLRYQVGEFGISPWDIFYNENYIGNSRVAQCSTIIKQRLAREYVETHFKKDDIDVVLGIDWSEINRVEAPTRNWSLHASNVLFPLCEPPYITKNDKIEMLGELGIDVPYLYKMGAEHNNCGNFCVRGGQKHFANLLELDEKLFDYHAEQERGLIEQIGKDVSILRKQRDGVRHTFPLSQLKRELRGGEEVDKFDIGGCGCFVVDDAEVEQYNGRKWGLNDLKVVY